MSAKITYFPVDNGDMTLVETDSGKVILIDTNIRKGDEFPDVLKMLRDRLPEDSDGRKFVHLFVWSHPDEDHCKGMEEHFHLGKSDDYVKEKGLIFINEIWSSPMVYRRASSNLTYSADAKALKEEVKRRVNRYKEVKSMKNGEYVQIVCEDDDGKTDDIGDIVLNLDSTTSSINGSIDSTIEARILAPSPKSDLEGQEDKYSKNKSSVIINYRLDADGVKGKAQFLSGGDAEVVCWETLVERMENANTVGNLKYNILQAPHHCSWHVMSNESQSKAKEDGRVAQPSDKALKGLGQALNEAIIVSSSKKIENDDNDPPAHAAKKEYVKIVDGVDGSFKCVADNIKSGKQYPLEIEIKGSGNPKVKVLASFSVTSEAPDRQVNRGDSDTYA